MADKIKYVIELELDSPESLYVTVSQHLTKPGKEPLVDLITSDFSPSISDALWWAGHEVAEFMGKDWL
jgi:hypothetical protein